MEQLLAPESIDVLHLLVRGIIPDSINGRVTSELIRCGMVTDGLHGLTPTAKGMRFVAAGARGGQGDNDA